MEILIWLVIIFTLFYEPVIGYFGYQKFKERVEVNAYERLKYYYNIMIGLWVPTFFIILITITTELTFQEIGIALPTINTETLGSIVTYIVIVIAVCYFLVMLVYILGYKFNKKIKEKFIESKYQQLNEISFAILLPVTKKEKKTWSYVSLTAGVTEEIIYRGFLIFAVHYLYPNLSIWLVMLIASFLFGLAHTYQGLNNVMRTTLIGYLFSILYIGLQSILPIIILHFLIDYVAKLGDKDEVL